LGEELRLQCLLRYVIRLSDLGYAGVWLSVVGAVVLTAVIVRVVVASVVEHVSRVGAVS